MKHGILKLKRLAAGGGPGLVRPFVILLVTCLAVSAGDIHPAKTALDLDNPHKGFILWGTDYAQGAPDNFYSSTVYHVYMPWREVETADQAFAWGRFETNHLKPILTNHPLATFILRPVADYPDGENSGITVFYAGGELQRDFPLFLIEPPLNITYWSYTNCGGDGPGRTPDWNNAVMITQMTQFVAAIRGRYDGDPRITAIQAGLLGLWGEWHQSGCEAHEPGTAAKVAVRDAYKLFTNTPIQIRYARNPDSIGVQFGFHEDYFPSFTGPCIYGFPDCDDTGDWNLYYGFTHVNTAAMHNWQSNPISGESPEDDQKRAWSNDFTDVMTVIRDYHFTGLGPAGGHEWSGNQVKLQAMKRALGYNLHLNRVAWPDAVRLDRPFEVTLAVTNSGAAPCYHRFPVELALCTGDGAPAWSNGLTCDLRQARPGPLLEHTEPITVSGISTGMYSLRIGVLDPRTGRPGVRLQTAGEDSRWRYTMGDIRVLSAPTTWYVATNGLDSQPGTFEQPWRTLTNAAARALAGDTVRVRAGLYTHRLVPVRSGTAADPILFAAQPGERPVLNGAGISLSEDEGLIDLSGRAFIRIEGFEARNSAGAGIYADGATNLVITGNLTSNTVSSGIGIWRSRGIIIESNEVVLACNDGAQECITVAVTDGFDVRHNRVHHGGPGAQGGEGIDAKDGSKNGVVHHNHVHHLNRLGIYVDAWDKLTTNIQVYANRVHDCPSGYAVASENGGLLADVRVFNNVAYSNQYGMFVGGWGEPGAGRPMRNIYIVNNTFADNGGGAWGGGISVENPAATNVVIRNNAVSQNQSFQIAVETNVPWSRLSIEYNLIDGYCGYDPDTETRGSNFVEGAARFINRATGDYRLQYGSPAIDAGTSTGAPAADFDGVIRPLGSGYDLGAFEYDAARTDSDSDGMDDAWEARHNFNPTNAADAALDADGDGFTNRDEWRTGTHPTNGQSYLRVAGILGSDGESNIALRWTGASGVLYNVERLTNLAVQPQSAMKIATNLPGQGDWITHGDTGALGPGPWIYRVGVE